MGGQCIFTCGVNEQYNQQSRQCECKSGFGLLQNVCNQCPAGYFVLNRYCVTCPIYASYNALSSRCECAAGFSLIGGRCVPQTCTAGQVFDSASQSCKCPPGQILQNGYCVSCPLNTIYDPVSQRCLSCQANQVLQNGQCVCQPGFGLTTNGNCASCSSINAQLVNGYCVVCPIGRTWINGVCVCPNNQIEVNGLCSSQCGPSQLADVNGICYFCPINEQIVNGQCVCVSGLNRDPVTRACQITCPPAQNVINGICGTCVLGTVYNAQLQSCVCPPGYFVNPQGVCESRIVPPPVCPAGFFLAANNNCAACPVGCSVCSSSLSCSSCTDPAATFINGICQSRRCGNGVLEFGETCDDFNTANGDGCNSVCQIEPNYQCIGSPSICRPVVINLCGNGLPNPGEQCDDNNNFAGDGCSNTCQFEQGWTCTPAVPGRPSVCTRQANPSSGMVASQVIVNSNAVYVTLLLDTAFTFASQAEMTQFIQYAIPAGFLPTSGYCRQRPMDLRIFDCLFNYPAGVPRTPYQISFSYSRNGINGYVTVPISTTNSLFFSRSLN